MNIDFTIYLWVATILSGGVDNDDTQTNEPSVNTTNGGGVGERKEDPRSLGNIPQCDCDYFSLTSTGRVDWQETLQPNGNSCNAKIRHYFIKAKSIAATLWIHHSLPMTMRSANYPWYERRESLIIFIRKINIVSDDGT